MMLDTKHPLMEGGCGQTFDWTVAKECQQARPMFIAGGLGPDNVAGDVLKKPPTPINTHQYCPAHLISDLGHLYTIAHVPKFGGHVPFCRQSFQSILNVFSSRHGVHHSVQSVSAWSGPSRSTPAVAWRPPKG